MRRPAALSLADDILALLEEPQGVVIKCACGSARYCPTTRRGLECYQQFQAEHAHCARTA